MSTAGTPSDHHGTQLAAETVKACQSRQQRLRSILAEQKLDALLVSNEKDIWYLTGFVGHDSLLLVSGGSTIIISDPRYDEFLAPWRKTGSVEVVMGVRHRLPESVNQLCQSGNVRRLGIQAEYITLIGRKKLASAIGEERLVETADIVGSLRRRKDDLEIRTILRAIDIQQQAITAALNQLAIGMTELEFSALLEFEMKSRGAFGSGFSPIIGAGANSSVIHYLTGRAPIQPGVLLVDWGATVDGYNSDMTRTFGIGEMPKKIREIYSIVLEAQLAAIAAIGPGKVCAEIDAVARAVITKAGYGRHFGHGLGHGLGMDIHEPPFFNDLETQTRLEPGMVMTVEPGIYLPGVGGVRIEDDVLITDNGCRVLSNWPKDLDSAVVEPATATGIR